MVRATCHFGNEGKYHDNHVHFKTEMIISYLRAKNAEGLKTQVRIIDHLSCTD